MSSSRKLVVRPAAQDDIRHILHFTLREWGERQWEHYANLLDLGMQRIRQFPEIGRRHIVGQDVVWTHRVEQHVVVYRFDDRHVDVLRIIHQRQSIAPVIPFLDE